MGLIRPFLGTPPVPGERAGQGKAELLQWGPERPVCHSREEPTGPGVSVGGARS